VLRLELEIMLLLTQKSTFQLHKNCTFCAKLHELKRPESFRWRLTRSNPASRRRWLLHQPLLSWWANSFSKSSISDSRNFLRASQCTEITQLAECVTFRRIYDALQRKTRGAAYRMLSMCMQCTMCSVSSKNQQILSEWKTTDLSIRHFKLLHNLMWNLTPYYEGFTVGYYIFSVFNPHYTKICFGRQELFSLCATVLRR